MTGRVALLHLVSGDGADIVEPSTPKTRARGDRAETALRRRPGRSFDFAPAKGGGSGTPPCRALESVGARP